MREEDDMASVKATVRAGECTGCANISSEYAVFCI